MNNQEQVNKIRQQYVASQPTALDELKALDAKVKRPANVFAYTFGSISAIVMGAGMSLVLTDIGVMIGLEKTMAPGIVIGVAGMAMAIANFFLHKKILNSRKKKFAPQIMELSDKIMNA